MKIINLVLFFCFSSLVLSSDITVVTIVGPVDKTSVKCEAGEVNFRIPVTTENLQGRLTMSLPLKTPEDAQASCILDPPATEQPVAATDEEYIYCIVTTDTFFYKNTLTFYPEYDFSGYEFEIEGWKEVFEVDPTISELMTCPVPKWEFTKLNTLADECDAENPGYHLMRLYGALNEEASEIKFDMPLFVNRQQVTASCVIWEVTENSGDINSAIKCLFLGDGILQVPHYMAKVGNDLVYIEATNELQLQATCSSSSISSWISLSSLLLFAIFLV